MRLGFLAEHGGRWNDLFKLKVRDSYKSNLCGICGDYNDDPANDFTTGPRCGAEDSPGSVVSIYIVVYNIPYTRLYHKPYTIYTICTLLHQYEYSKSAQSEFDSDLCFAFSAFEYCNGVN